MSVEINTKNYNKPKDDKPPSTDNKDKQEISGIYIIAMFVILFYFMSSYVN